MMRQHISRIHPVYAMTGADRFLRSLALGRILREIGEEGSDPVRLTANDEMTLADVLDEVRTLSLFDGRRIVIVDNADVLISANRVGLERYCASPCNSGSLILLCKSLAKNTRLYKTIDKQGRVASCKPLEAREVAGWIVRRAREEYGKRVSTATARMLRACVGDSAGVLDAELAKLATYVGGRGEIKATDIDVLTGHHKEEKIFAVTDAMSSGDTAGALRQWEQVLATDPAAPGRAIAGLAWGVRRLWQIRRDWQQGADLYGLSRKCFTDSATLQRRLERVSLSQLEEQQRDLLAADVAIKSGLSKGKSAVTNFIVKHSATSPTSP